MIIAVDGPTASGKSALALDLMSRGAGLIADDRVCVTRRGDAVIADCPPALEGRIEARGLGILTAVLGTPLFLWLLLGPRADGWAVVVLAVGGFTDWLDGKLARLRPV